VADDPAVSWRGFISAALAAGILTAATTWGQQPGAPPPAPLVRENATVKVSDHVYVIPDNSAPAVPNVGIIVGNTATVVIDTGLGPRNGEAILREVAKVSRNTQLYLVTTHFHPEHAAGSSAFPASAKFVISNAQQKDLDELASDLTATFAGRTPAMGELLKDVKYRRADILFEREHTLDLGGLRVKLLSLGPMHTRGDTMIFVEGDAVLFAGDVVNHRAFLAFSQYSSGKAWLSTLDQLDALRPKIVVPAHGAMGTGASIVEQRDVLKALQARVRELKAQGKSADEAAALLVAELQMKYTGWNGANRLGAAARTFYNEN
jgi:glyoxylase-like metal-dependent hydrolase (beta-lactamase superfamily II)